MIRGSPIVACALTVVLYIAAGLAGLSLMIVPGSAPPLFPATGVALAAVLIGGRRLLPAVWLGALLLHLITPGPVGPTFSPTLVNLALAASLACCLTLQAAIAAWLIRRFVPQPLTLSGSLDMLRFAGCAAVAGLLGSGVGNLLMDAFGRPPTVGLRLNLPAWWLGDLMGVLIVVPIGLAFFGQPRVAWAPRRQSVGVMLGLITLLLAAGIHAVAHWHEERRVADFERDAAGAARLLSTQLREPMQVLKALHGAVLAAGAYANPATMPAAMRVWLESSQLEALAWAQWLRRDEVPTFVASVQAGGLPDFRVFDLPGSTIDIDAEVAAVRHIEPLRQDNAASLGLNLLSVPSSRAAILVSRRTGQAAATAGLYVYKPEGSSIANGLRVLVFQVMARAPDPSTGMVDALPLGIGFTVMNPERELAAVHASLPDYLRLCLVDLTPGAPERRLAGAAGCEAASAGPLYTQPLEVAGRQWELRVTTRREDLPGARDLDVWFFALLGVLATALLGGLLLLITSRTRRIEIAVHERTAALRAEVQERELAQTALRESEQRFRNILNNVPMGICYTDLRGNVKQTNPQFCELVGYSEAELLTMTAADFTHPDDRATDYQCSVELIEGRIPLYRRQKRYVTGNATVIRVQTTVTLLRDASGRPRRLVGVVEDVTEHLRLEDAERAREAAEASNQAKSEFLSRMSHELRTPLNAMLGFAQLLELDPRQPLGTLQRTWVNQIQQAGWHLLEMINDVLDLSRIESGNLRLQTEMLNIDDLIEATRAMVQADADRRQIVVVQERPSGALSAIGDATRVKQILINLLSNAVKYNADGGRIHIVSRRVSEQVVEVSVSDSGLGMSPEQLAQLFQPFNRLGREKSNLEGTGIGLVISQRLAELMGGTLRAHSVAGAGSTFSLTLPCENEPSTIPSDFDGVAPDPIEYHRRVVHYVEDNETNVEVMRGILAQRPQVELEVSVTGLDGLAAIRARRPDLVLLDMHLPDISGMELLRHLKADARLAPIPVVVVSADALAPQVEAAYDAGCTNYLTKPVNIASLLHLVDTLLEEMDTRYN